MSASSSITLPAKARVVIIGLGYVACAPEETQDDMLVSRYELEVAGEAFPALASFKPLHDPKSERIRA
jgi:hypothetical protein